jgi:anti-sigma factor RsiW
MDTYFNLITETQSREVCTCPSLGARLPDYIVELLEDLAAEEVEDHLLECRHCKERYLTILRIRSAALQARRGQEGVEQPDSATEDDRLQQTPAMSGKP